MPLELIKCFTEPSIQNEAQNVYDAIMITLEMTCDVLKSTLKLIDTTARASLPVVKNTGKLVIGVGKLVLYTTCLTYAVGCKTIEGGKYLFDKYQTYNTEDSEQNVTDENQETVSANPVNAQTLNLSTESANQDLSDEEFEETQTDDIYEALNNSENELTVFPKIEDSSSGFSLSGCFTGISTYLSRSIV